mgnify:CR=1 FL=1
MKYEIYVLNSSTVIHLLLSCHYFFTYFIDGVYRTLLYIYIYIGGMDRRGGDKPGVSAADRDDTAAAGAAGQNTGGRGGGADTGRRISESSSRSESDSQQQHLNNQQQQRAAQQQGRRGGFM